MGLVEVVLLPLFSALFGVPLLRPGVLLVTALGTLGYAAVGTLLAAIAVNTRAREVMLPIMLLPLAIPALIASVRATGVLVEGGALGYAMAWVRLLVVYDLIIVAVALLTFGYVLEE
jgi:heme exporter protein B